MSAPLAFVVMVVLPIGGVVGGLVLYLLGVAHGRLEEIEYPTKQR